MTSAVALPLVHSAAAAPPPYAWESSLQIRAATPDDAPAIHGLITRHLDEGHLLPRQLGEIAVHTSRFVVAVSEGPSEAGHDEAQIVGCADLAPLSRTVAEIRSLVVSDAARSAGVGRRLIDSLIARASVAEFERVCAFTHAPSYFVRLGFSLVPHDWLPEKIRTDCGACALFRQCGQYAVMLPLRRARQLCVPLASLHG